MPAWLPIVIASIVVGGLIVVFRMSEDNDHGTLRGLKLWQSWQIPFLLTFSDEFSEVELDRLKKAFAWATEYWNENTSLSLFADVIAAKSLVPVMPEEMEGQKLARVNFIKGSNGEIVSVSIKVDPHKLGQISQEKLHRAAAHELGHLLGLAHDDVKLSIMWPDLSPTDAPVVTAADRELLRNLYS